MKERGRKNESEESMNEKRIEKTKKRRLNEE
jgi:hypothetical protein